MCKLKLEKYKNHLLQCLETMNEIYEREDCNHITMIFMIIQGLDMMNALPEDTEYIKEYVYNLQVVKDSSNTEINENTNIYCYGFRGSVWFGHPFRSEIIPKEIDKYDSSRLAFTYSALVVLLTLRDDLGRVNKKGIIDSLKYHQTVNGNFYGDLSESESDLRFLYCASCISFLLNDYSGIDIEKAVDYIKQCQSPLKVFGLRPGLEPHGGATFCAIASLSCLGKLHEVISEEDRLEIIQWLIERQTEGFAGRTNKPDDLCYSYWIGSTLGILGGLELINKEKLLKYLGSCQHLGGFSKSFDCDSPDCVHTGLAAYGLSICGCKGFYKYHFPTGLRIDRLPDYLVDKCEYFDEI